MTEHSIGCKTLFFLNVLNDLRFGKSNMFYNLMKIHKFRKKKQVIIIVAKYSYMV